METNVESKNTRARPQKGSRKQPQKSAHRPTSVFEQLSNLDPGVQDEGWERLLSFAEYVGQDSNPHAWENLTKLMLAQFSKLRPEIAGRMIEIAATKIKVTQVLFGENSGDQGLQREYDRRREVLRRFCIGVVGSCEGFLAGNPDELDRVRTVDVLIMLFGTLDTCLQCSDKDIAACAVHYRLKFGRGPGKHLPNSVEDMLRRRGIVNQAEAAE